MNTPETMKTKRSKHPKVPPMRLAAEIGRTFRHRERAKKAHYLPGVAEFSDDDLLRDPVYIVNAIQACTEVWDILERGTTDWATYERRHGRSPHVAGRPRSAGHYALAACAWLLSGEDGEMEPWRVNRQSFSELWNACGFDDGKAPDKSTWHERITELEERFIDGIYDATSKLWETAQNADPCVGRHFRFDGRPYESHARLEHACLDPDECALLGGRPKHYLDRASVDAFNAQRHKEQEEAPDEVLPEDADEEETNQERTDRRDPWDVEEDLEEWALEHGIAEQEAGRKLRLALKRAREEGIEIDKRGNRVVWINGHRYICRDVEAGYRLIEGEGKRRRGWLGGIAAAMNDSYLDIEAFVHHFPADEPEHGHHYVQTLKGLRRIIGANPEAVVFDRGLSTRYDRELNNLLGVASVGPFRKPSASIDSRQDLAKPGYWDGYGFPRCRFCNSPGLVRGNGLGFDISRQLISFRCSNPHTADCITQLQSQPANEEPLLFGIISRDDPLYYGLRNQGRPGEHSNSNSRRRYGTDGKNQDTRAKRIGTRFMRLRAAFACFLDIFRVCLRRGWIGNHPRERLHTANRILRDGREGAEANTRLRAMHGLLLPYGPEAEALGLVWHEEGTPEGWVPVKTRREEAKKERERKRLKLRRERVKQRAADRARGRGSPTPGRA